MGIARRLRTKAALIESKFLKRRWPAVALFKNNENYSIVKIKRRGIIGKGDFENVVFSVDVLKGDRLLKFVEKVYGHPDARAVWYDMRILGDLRKAGCDVPRTVRIIPGSEKEMPTLVMSDLRFGMGHKSAIGGIGILKKLKNIGEVKKQIIRNVERAAKIGYKMREDAFLIAADKNKLGRAFVVDVDWVFGPKKVDHEEVMAYWGKRFGELNI